MSDDVACPCGAKELEVHRVACPVWLEDLGTSGNLQCPNCPKHTNNLTNGFCAVCLYWRTGRDKTQGGR